MASKLEEITAKIQKLLKLSEGSSNIHEAQSAASRAQKLMLEYNIEQMVEDVEMKSPKESIEDFSNNPIETTGRFENWRFSLLGVICRINACTAVKRRTFKSETNIYMIGRKTDVQTVKYIYQYLNREIENLARMQKGRGKKFIASYKIGCVSGVQENLNNSYQNTFKEKYEEAAKQGTTALMRIDDAVKSMTNKVVELDLWVKKNTNIVNKTINWKVSSGSGMEQGFRDGKNIRTQVAGPALNSPVKQMP